MDERGVTQVLDRLRTAEVLTWLDGGWGVDALLGTQTRPHSDLDLVVHRSDLETVRAVLEALGYSVVRDWLPTAIAFRADDGKEVDLHPVDPTPDGGGDQIQLDGESRWHYSAPVRGAVGGRPVLCCPVTDQVACHVGYPPRDSDFEDMRRLADRFGFALPPPYAQA